MKRYISSIILSLLLLFPVAFTSCGRPDSKVDVNLASDYSGIAEAISNGSRSLSETLSLIESAVANGFADHNEAEMLLQQAIVALDGTLEQKMAAIEGAVNSEAVGLSAKLELIGAAASSGFADSAKQQALIKEAIDSVTGDAGAKMAAIETAVQGQTASLSMKLGLIETAVKEGLANEKEVLVLLQKAVGSLSDDAAERIAAISDAMSSQASSLSAKLNLLAVAIGNNMADQKEALALIHQAVESLDGTAEENLSEVESAIQRQQLTLETKLGLIEAAVAEGFADSVAQQVLLKQAIEGLGENSETLLEAIATAVSSESMTLSSKLVLIDTAVREGFAADSLQAGLIKDAIVALPGSIKDKLDAINTAMNLQTAGLGIKLETIQQTYADSLANSLEALGLIETAVASIDKSAADMLDKLSSIEGKSLNSLVVEALNNIKRAISGLQDYGEILEAIEAAIADLNIPLTLEFEDFVKDGVLVMGCNTLLKIPFSLTNADCKIEATASEGINVTVKKDPDKPLEGTLEISASSITDGTSKAEITVSSRFKSKTQTIEIVQAQLSAPAGQDKTLLFDDTFDEENPLELRYSTNTSTTVSIPDDVDWLRQIYVPRRNSATADSVIFLAVDLNAGFYLRSTSVTVTNNVGSNALTFSIVQDYNSTKIEFDKNNYSLESAFVKDKEHINFNEDNYISYAEAAAVTSLTSLFGDSLTGGNTYNSFDEFQYFTGIEKLPAGSFKGWGNLTSITLPPNIKIIEGGYVSTDGPFINCPKLSSIKGKFSVDDIMLVFKKKLLKVAETATSVTIPADETLVKIIGTYAFHKSNVEKIKIPENVTIIRDHAFEYSQLESVEFAMKGDNPETALSYADSIAETTFIHCFRLKKFIGPKYEKSIIRVTPDNLGLCRDTTLYAYALGADAQEFVIPESMGVKRLGEGVFDVGSYSTSLKKIGLPSTLNRIRTKAFGNQSGIELYFRGGNPPKVEPDAFQNTTAQTITIYVPAVMSGGTVDEAATEARIAQFEAALGMGSGYFVVDYYTDWPLDH